MTCFAKEISSCMTNKIIINENTATGKSFSKKISIMSCFFIFNVILSLAMVF